MLRNSIILLLLLSVSSSISRSQNNDPQKAAQGQLEAYNNQDIDGFLKWYSDDVEVYNFPSELVYKGKEKMRARYLNAWKENPNQKAEVTNRIINGNTVVDREHVTGRSSGIEANVIAVYRIEGGLISKVYFIRD